MRTSSFPVFARVGLAAGLTAAIVWSCTRPEPVPDLKGQNLLIITIDTLRADRLGAYGDVKAETPRLDALAAGGVRFENVYSPVPLTLPAHSSLFTSRYPFDLGVRVNGTHFLTAEATTLAEILEASGYSTFAAVGAYVLTSKFGLAQGFQRFDDTLGSSDLFKAFESEIPADQVVDKLERWLGTDRPEPFFAWLHVYDPHLPYQPPEPYATRFADDPYRGEIAFVDSQVGRILDRLETDGLLDRTLVLVTSDHGDAFLEHGEEGHGLLVYDETLRVPAVLYAPGRLPGGRVVSQRVHLVDFLPTLLELLGVELPTRLRGSSLAGALVEGEPEPRVVYFESMAGPELKNWAPLAGVLVENTKYIRAPEAELYDLLTDPGEQSNLVELRQEDASRLDAILRGLLESAQEASLATRELTSEDQEHLEALGYLDTSGRSASGGLDPKKGIAIDMAFRAARRLLKDGHVEQAGELLEQVIAQHPDIVMPDVFELRHDVAAAEGKQDTAVAELERGVATFPDLEPLRFKLASYLAEIGRDAESESLAREMVAANPLMSQAHILLGLLSDRKGDVSLAVTHYELALEVETGSVPLRSKLAEVLLRAGYPQRSLEIYDALVEEGVVDDDGEALFKAGMLNSRYGSMERAESLFRRGLQVEPGGVHYLTFAIILAENGKIPDATAAVETALREYRHDLNDQQVALATAFFRQWTGQGG